MAMALKYLPSPIFILENEDSDSWKLTIICWECDQKSNHSEWRPDLEWLVSEKVLDIYKKLAHLH